MSSSLSSLSSLPNLHPLFVHFPVASFTFALLTDCVILMRVRRRWLDQAALLWYVVAAVSGLVSAVTGKIAADALAGGLGKDAVASVDAHSDAAFLTVVLFFAVAFLRLEAWWRDMGEGRPVATRARIVALALAVAAQWSILLTAARGGELVYRYGIGVAVDAHGATGAKERRD